MTKLLDFNKRLLFLAVGQLFLNTLQLQDTGFSCYLSSTDTLNALGSSEEGKQLPQGPKQQQQLRQEGRGDTGHTKLRAALWPAHYRN